LTRLTKKTEVFHWGTEQQEAFEELKEAVCESVTLASPRGPGPYVLFTDASDVGVGCVFTQKQDDEIAVLAYASKKLTTAEKNWSVSERELYAIVWACKRFHSLLRGAKIIVFTDHEALKYLDTLTVAGKIQRWVLWLQQYDLTIRHVKGVDNSAADWLSRNPDEEDPIVNVEEIAIPVFHAQLTGSYAPSVPTREDIVKAYEAAPEADLRMTMEGTDKLRYDIRSGRIYIPPGLQEGMLAWFHLSKYGLHMGIGRMLRRMTKWVWWPKISRSIQEYVAGCLVCSRRQRPTRTALKGLLSRPMPLELVSLDCVGPRRWGGIQYYYVVLIDHCTRFVQAAM
jgi:hypothetical protein